MKLTDTQLIMVEKKYFLILEELISKNLGKIISQISSQKRYLDLTKNQKVNPIDKSIENVIEQIIALTFNWNIASLPVSSDSCYECGDAIVHLDAKTIKDNNSDNNDKINVENSQTTYDSEQDLMISGFNWKAKLKHYEKHEYFGYIPNLAYLVKVIYSDKNSVEEIYLLSLPHGQLYNYYTNNNLNILAAGKSLSSKNKLPRRRTNIRFDYEEIIKIDSWRSKCLFKLVN